MSLSWIGSFQTPAAYPTINRHMTAALERAGVDVVRNAHTFQNQLTPVAVTCDYPPSVPSLRHTINAAYFTWEFPQIQSFPRSFLRVFDQLDLLLTMSAWVADQLRGHVACQIDVVPLGFDPAEFDANLPKADWAVLFPGEAWAMTAEKVMLWVGGTDQRHGFDVALEVLDLLPESVHLVAKWNLYYPPATHRFNHPRLHHLYVDLPSLAPLYRAADLYLHSARGVGFSLPVLEALACGTKVVSTDLPPVREYGEGLVTFASEGSWRRFTHHLPDCDPLWWEPDRFCLAEAVETALWGTAHYDRDLIALWNIWRSQWTWDAAAVKMRQSLGV